MNPEAELGRMTVTLKLTDQQKVAILPILQERHAAMEQLMHNTSDRASAGNQMHELMDNSNRKIRTLLSEEQAKLFDAMRPPRPPQGGGPGQETNSTGSQSSSGDQGPPQGPPPGGGGPPQQ